MGTEVLRFAQEVRMPCSASIFLNFFSILSFLSNRIFLRNPQIIKTCILTVWGFFDTLNRPLPFVKGR